MKNTFLAEKVILSSDQNQSDQIQINYSFTLGFTWGEGGISKVNNFLSALGFTSSKQIADFCASVNVFKLFGEAQVKSYINNADRQLIYGESQKSIIKFRPNFSVKTTVNPLLGEQNPSYNDFFQMHFTWLTHGQNAETRKKIIEWWSDENGISTDPKLAYVANKTPRHPQKVIQWDTSVPISFKNAVDEFLKQSQNENNKTDTNNFVPLGFIPPSGAIPYAIGQPSIVRIPIPNTNGLCIEFKARGSVPKGGSTSTLFYQDIKGKRHLRLDYGYNVKTKTIDYHWNQKGTHANFGIPDHTPTGSSGATIYKAAKYFRYAGRALVIVGVTLDVISIVQASKPLKQATEVVAGWAGAWAGCKVVGMGGAAVGSLASPIGTTIGGVGGCIIGGAGGYYLASNAAATVYDWAEGTFFTPLPEIQKL